MIGALPTKVQSGTTFEMYKQQGSFYNKYNNLVVCTMNIYEFLSLEYDHAFGFSGLVQPLIKAEKRYVAVGTSV